MPLKVWLIDDDQEKRSQARRVVESCLVAARAPAGYAAFEKDALLTNGTNREKEPLPQGDGPLLVVLDIDAPGHADAGVALYKRFMQATRIPAAQVFTIVWSGYAWDVAARGLEAENRLAANLVFCEYKTEPQLTSKVTMMLERIRLEQPDAWQATVTGETDAPTVGARPSTTEGEQHR